MASLEWDGEYRLVIDFIRRFDPALDSGAVPIITTPTSAYIEATGLFPESILDSYADRPLSMRLVFRDRNADGFIVDLDKAPVRLGAARGRA